MEEVHSTVKHFNENIHKVEVSYAYGYAFSEDYSECTMKTLFNKADKHMYENKAIEKARDKRRRLIAYCKRFDIRKEE